MKRILATLLVIAMCFGFAGCGTNKTSGEIPTLLWLVPGDTPNDLALINEEASKITREKIGANIEIKFIDSIAYTERLNMMMASSEDFDICQLSSNTYLKSYELGGLEEIGQYLKKYAPELMEQLPDYAIKAVTTETGIYVVPNQQIMAFGTGYYMRKDLVEKYNIDIDKIENCLSPEFERALTLIRDNEPDVVPTARLVSSAFNPAVKSNSPNVKTISINGSTVYLNVENNKVMTFYELPGMREASVNSYEFYKKGFYRSDIATQRSSGFGDSYYKAGKYGVVWCTYIPGVEAELKSGTGYDYVRLFNTTPVMKHTDPLATCVGVSRTSKNPEKAVEFINLINTDVELYNLVCFGIEGKHYEKLDDVHIRVDKDSGYAPLAAWKFGNQFNAYCLEGADPEDYEETKRINDESIKSPVLGIVFETDEINTELAQIAKVQSQYLDARINTGIEHPDTYWDEFVSEMEKAGIEKVREVYQRQVDEFLAK